MCEMSCVRPVVCEAEPCVATSNKVKEHVCNVWHGMSPVSDVGVGTVYRAETVYSII